MTGKPGDRSSIDAEAPLLTPPTATAPSRRSVVVRGALVIGLFVFIFGVLIPSFVDYEEVVRAIVALEPAELAVVAALALVAYLIEAAAVSAPLPGLSLARGMWTYFSASAVKSTIPAPVDLPLRYALFRQWGHSPAASTLAVAINGILDQLSRLLLPVIAAALVLLEGTLTPGLALFAAIGGIAFVVVAGFGGWMLRSAALTARVGRLVERVAGWVFTRLKRPAPTGVPERVVGFRDATRELLVRRGLVSLATATGAKIAWAVVLIAGLRFAGVPADVLPAPTIFAIYAAVWLIMILPIAPGGAGVPELILIAGLGSIAGPGYEAAVTAGVFLYRVFQYFLLIPVGWVTLWLVRRGAPGGLLATRGQTSDPVPALGGTSGGIA